MCRATAACPGCGLASARQNGRDRRGRQLHRCRGCQRRFTARSATPFAGDRFPADVIALAVRWYLRYRLRDADVAELLAERGVRVDASTVFDRVRAFAPRYEDAARPFRRAVGSSWSVDEPSTQVAGQPVDVYRAIDGQGQVVDVYVRRRRATADAAACFRRAIAATGVVPNGVATDGAAAYPPALAAARPSRTRQARRPDNGASATTSTCRGGRARRAGSRRSPGRASCAERTPSCATCTAASTSASTRSTP